MARYTYEAKWNDTEQSGEVEMFYPEVIALFDSLALKPTEVTVVTDMGIRITWFKHEDEDPSMRI